jgi:hypothetical protein
LGEPGSERVPAAVDDAVDESLGGVLLVAARSPAAKIRYVSGMYRERGTRAAIQATRSAAADTARNVAANIPGSAATPCAMPAWSRIGRRTETLASRKKNPENPAAADASSSRSMRMKGQYGAPSTGTTPLRRVARPLR